VALTTGANPPTWQDVEDALGSLTARPAFTPYARFEHNGTAVALLPAAVGSTAHAQAVLEHIARDHAGVSAYISGMPATPATVLVILATRGTADLDRVLSATDLAPDPGTEPGPEPG